MAKGKWASGITPRNFTWVVKERLAICERPGGYGDRHRKVRRQEEIIWIREQQFDQVVSLIPAPHNLHNYDELGVSSIHRPFPAAERPEADSLFAVYAELRRLQAEQKKTVVHGEEVGDELIGIVGGYLIWNDMLDSTTEAISIMERIIERQLGPRGRELIALAQRLPQDDVADADADG